MIYIVSYRSQFDSHVVAAFYDEHLAQSFVEDKGYHYVIECFMGPHKVY